jgi:hypothetical protein
MRNQQPAFCTSSVSAADAAREEYFMLDRFAQSAVSSW